MQSARSVENPVPGMPATDAEIAARAAAGDVVAFEQIMRRHNRLLFRTARSILKADADAEDALQDAYLRAWRAMGEFRAEARLSTWLVRIVVNEALGRLRRRSAPVIALDPSMEPGSALSEADMAGNPDERPDRVAMRSELRGMMEARIDALPDAFRTVFVLRAVEEMSVGEIAALLGLREETVRTRFFRARGLLREGLARDIDVTMSDAFSFAGERCDRIVTHVTTRIRAIAQDAAG